MDVDVVNDIAQFKIACLRSPDAVIVDATNDDTGELFQQAFLELSGTRVARRSILIADLVSKEDFLDLLQADLLHHVIASSGPGALFRLTTTVAKLITGQILGFRKYLPWGLQVREAQIRRTRDKTDTLDALSEYCDFVGMPSRLASLARTVADEFFMNALFDAPVDAQGNHIFANRNRSDDIELPPDHMAKLRFCCHGECLVIGVYDSFGSLTAGAIRDNLTRTLQGGADQVRADSAGAGVGLYMAFKALSDWIINVVPGQATEMIGMIRTSGTYRNHIMMPKSFHFFEAATDRLSA